MQRRKSSSSGFGDFGINVTPIIDVMLVLLVLFMILTPVSQKGLDVRLPESVESDPFVPPPASTIRLSVDENRNLSLNGRTIAWSSLSARLSQALEVRLDKTVFVDADAKLRYRDVVQVLDLVRGAGSTRIGIIDTTHR